MQSSERAYITMNGKVFRLSEQDVQGSHNRDAVHHRFYIKRGPKEEPTKLLVSVLTSGLVERLIKKYTDEDIGRRIRVNRIREALDKGELDFSKPQELPVFQELNVDTEWWEKYLNPTETGQLTDREVREFIAQKVYWLGYMVDGMNAQVDLNDPADWEYLRVTKEVFKRNIEFLQQDAWIVCTPQEPFLVQPTTKLVSKLEQPPHRLYAEKEPTVDKRMVPQTIKSYPPLKLKSIKIQGYRPFKDFIASFGSLEVLVGANGSGKSSLFEFLKFLRDNMEQDIPPEIVADSVGQQVFHKPGPEQFSWSLDIDVPQSDSLQYQGELRGPVGRIHIPSERVQTVPAHKTESYSVIMNVIDGQGVLQEPKTVKKREIALKRSKQLALSTVSDPEMATLNNLREYIRGWRFYDSFNIANDKIRKPVPIGQEPVLDENGENLSSVLHYLMTEHQPIFDDLQQHLRSFIPGFKRLTVKARGGPGEVIAFWQEEGVNSDLSLADLSDGILRLICWTVLCVQPNPPSLICIDEPDQGVHPRTLPLLAGLLEKACDRTQVLVATHTSYFLAQFLAKVDDISRIAVMRKENGEARFIKPKDSRALVQNLEDFGPEEIEIMHRSDELELLP